MVRSCSTAFVLVVLIVSPIFAQTRGVPVRVQTQTAQQTSRVPAPSATPPIKLEDSFTLRTRR